MERLQWRRRREFVYRVGAKKGVGGKDSEGSRCNYMQRKKKRVRTEKGWKGYKKEKERKEKEE